MMRQNRGIKHIGRWYTLSPCPSPHRILELRMREAWFAHKLRMREQRLMMHALCERRNKRGSDMWTCMIFSHWISKKIKDGSLARILLDPSWILALRQPDSRQRNMYVSFLYEFSLAIFPSPPISLPLMLWLICAWRAHCLRMLCACGEGDPC